MLSQRSVAMSSDSENKLIAAPSGGEAAPSAGTAGALMRQEGSDAAAAEEPPRDHRLDRLRLQLDVMVKVRSFRVGELLSLARGGVIETVQEHAQDVPVHCGGVVLGWAEFEVLEQKLAVRITRIA
jgi:flagellar motor switch protein FliN/FliY